MTSGGRKFIIRSGRPPLSNLTGFQVYMRFCQLDNFKNLHILLRTYTKRGRSLSRPAPSPRMACFRVVHMKAIDSDAAYSPRIRLAIRLRASDSIWRTRSRVSPISSPISFNVLGSESSRPKRNLKIFASRSSIVSSMA